MRFLEEVVAKMPGVTQARTVLVPWKLKDVYELEYPPPSVEEGGGARRHLTSEMRPAASR